MKGLFLVANLCLRGEREAVSAVQPSKQKRTERVVIHGEIEELLKQKVLPRGHMEVLLQHPRRSHMTDTAGHDHDCSRQDDHRESDLVPWPVLQCTMVPRWLRHDDESVEATVCRIRSSLLSECASRRSALSGGQPPCRRTSSYDCSGLFRYWSDTSVQTSRNDLADDRRETLSRFKTRRNKKSRGIFVDATGTGRHTHTPFGLLVLLVLLVLWGGDV